MALPHKNAVNEYLVETGPQWPKIRPDFFNKKKLADVAKERDTLTKERDTLTKERDKFHDQVNAQVEHVEEFDAELQRLRAEVKTLKEDIHILENTIHVQKVDNYIVNNVPEALAKKKIVLAQLQYYSKQIPEELLQKWTWIEGDHARFANMILTLNECLKVDEDTVTSEQIVELLPLFDTNWLRRAGTSVQPP